jgi:DNA-binding LytR/AlgR family response regulator
MLLEKDINLLVLEDSSRFSSLLKIMLEEIGINSVHFATHYDEAITLFYECNPDVMILDIHLGNDEKSGIDFAEFIRGKNYNLPLIYLTSNYSEEFYQSCRHTRPSCFMSKEISNFKLFQAIDLALNSPKGADSAVAVTTTPPNPPPLIDNSIFFFKVGNIYKSINVQQINYFYTDLKSTFAKVDQRNFPTAIHLKTLEKEFFPSFLRIHKSYLVNVKMIDSINLGEGTIIINGETLPIGYMYRKAFLEQLNLVK